MPNVFVDVSLIEVAKYYDLEDKVIKSVDGVHRMESI